jgi:uncharacterized protein YeaO (DUF488 family)
MMELAIKRIYDEPATSDGYRVLVDRLWPRGMSKQKAALNDWCKEIAPSTELREWFGHKPERFQEFKARYEDELQHNAKLAEILAEWQNHQKVTLLYATRDPRLNEATIIKEFIESRL